MKSIPFTGSMANVPRSSLAISSPMLQVDLYLRIMLPPLLVTLLLWTTSSNDISLLQWLGGFLLLSMPWGSYLWWKRGRAQDTPLFAMIGLVFWLYYVFPLFWGDRLAVGFWSAGESISESAVTGTILMAALGVFSIWAGIKSGLGGRLQPRIIADLPSSPAQWGYLRVVMILGGILGLFEVQLNVLGEEYGQIFYILLTIVPLVPFAILFRNYVQGKADQLDKGLLAAFLGLQCITSMASGWLGSLVYLMITCAAIYIVEKKRIPKVAIILLVLYVLFFQVGKFSVREKYWYGGEKGSKVERIAFWMNESMDKWGEALSDSSGQLMRDTAYHSLSRVSLLASTSNVLELTPSTVPYQYGSLYSYMVVALIPRFIWPDKPSFNEANRFYQTSYGITAEDDLDYGSFSAGILAESYINFSWFGVVGVMLLLGVFFDFFQKTFLAGSSGSLLPGIGSVLLPFFLSIDGQMSVYLGGVVQRTFFILLVLLPVVRFRRVPKAKAS